MTFPQAPALPEELDRLMRRMRLPYMRKAAPDVLATARAQRWDPAEVLRLLIAEEVTGRDAATRRLRRHSANFPTGKTLRLIHPRSELAKCRARTAWTRAVSPFQPGCGVGVLVGMGCTERRSSW
ncbi:hypothetical protein [Streptomyces mirabilis]|uniref:hypothetical protein n=1 Tax=Streptomyces mirabilis TaxID=68239 RepID=UPI0022554239|nr:hypothetical protein [Streptomyces mirabilis]MCX4428843.1 hypothetical protein [Streptomyces mirabilis]